MATLNEQIALLESTRAAKEARMANIMSKTIEEGRSSDPAEQEEFDTLKDELKALDDDLERLHIVERIQAQKAKPVDGVTRAVDGAVTRAARLQPSGISVVEPKLPPGIAFTRYCQSVMLGKGNLMQSYEIAKQRYPHMTDLHEVLRTAYSGGTTTDWSVLTKAAVPAATTQDVSYAGPLVAAYPRFAGDFVEYLMPQTIIGRLGTGGLPSPTRVPFNVSIAGQTSLGTAYWVGEGKPKPLTYADFGVTNLGFAKVAAVSVMTEELIRLSTPSAETLIRNMLANAVISKIDTDFISPTKTASAGVSPASITNGATTVTSSGNHGDAIRLDIANALDVMVADYMPLSNLVWIMPVRTAVALMLMRNALGQREFPDMTVNGGMLEGIPVLASEHVATSSAGTFVALVSVPDIWVADDGQVVIDASREASIEMLDNPTDETVSGTATSMVSLWQTNSVGIRAERWVNWARRRTHAVVYIDSVFWGHAAASGT